MRPSGSATRSAPDDDAARDRGGGRTLDADQPHPERTQLIGTVDDAIPPAELLAMAHQAHARITIIPGAPHLSMISNPGTVTRVILQAIHATA
jgi:pimeloyl-ACP methyl ester carboxylesterase